MNLLNAFSIGFKEIWAHKFRSALTMLGIILGVASLVGMSALVKGIENGMREALIAVGGLEKVRIEENDLPANQQHLADQAVGVTMADVYAIQRNADLVRAVTPEMRMRDALMTHGAKTYNSWYFTGTWPSALDMNQHTVQYGRMFNEVDDENARNVCVIGTAARDALFGSPEETGKEIIPIGEKVNVKGEVFTIIGMFQHYESEQDAKKRELAKLQTVTGNTNSPSRQKSMFGRKSGGSSSYIFTWKNSTVYIPLNTMWLKFRSAAGSNNIPDPRLSSLSVKVRDVNNLDPTIRQLRNVLMLTHHGIEDFAVQTQEDWAERINSAVANARMSGGLISLISLLVGGIGITNIMLASITERIREIGIRKAIGATYSDIFIQILVESVVIAIIGGAVGLLASLGLVEVLTLISKENTPVITLSSMILAFCFSAGVGVLAGLIPAFKAAKLDPIQALRYE
jgi:putative ABC transport system permease protein